MSRGLLWLTRADAARSSALELLPRWPTVESVLAPAGEAELRGVRVFLFAGIARPERFEVSVRALGAVVAGTRWFRDHHWYSEAELERLRSSAQGAALLTTEKDLVRLRDPSGIRALRMELKVTERRSALDAALDEVLR